jgi:predicted secreted protein
MSRSIIVLFLTVTGLIFNGCSTGAASGKLTEKDNNRTIELEMDSPFTVDLTGDHNSGYKWKLVSDNKPAIVLIRSEITSDGNKDI